MRRGTLTLPLGQYLPGSSPLHKLDARLKLLATLAVVPVLFLVEGWAGLGIVAAGVLACLLVARVPLGYVVRGLGPLAIILVLTFAFQAIGYPGTTWIALGPLTITYEGVDAGAFLAARLFLLLTSGMALTLTTPPVSLTDAMEWSLRPLGRFRLPTAEVAMMMTIALRFIPTLLRELDDLIKAQRARGVDLTVRDPARLVQALLPIMVPLFVLSFRRADDLAIAMTSRCYRGGHGRTRYRELSFGVADAVALGLVVLWLGLALTAGRVWGADELMAGGRTLLAGVVAPGGVTALGGATGLSGRVPLWGGLGAGGGS